MFQQTLMGSPNPDAMATARAATDVVEGKVPVSTACSMYNVREQTVIQYIIDKTEYETVQQMKEDQNDT